MFEIKSLLRVWLVYVSNAVAQGKRVNDLGMSYKFIITIRSSSQIDQIHLNPRHKFIGTNGPKEKEEKERKSTNSK